MNLVRNLGAAALLLFAAAGPALAQDDAAFATELWNALAAERLVGEHAITAVPYPREGQAHAELLVTLSAHVTIGGVEGLAIAKRSYGADGATRESILNDPARYLSNVTVMFQREDGYDADNGNWFWAMYMPDGMVGQMEGNSMAGRIGMCIDCHTNADGGDMVFLYNPGMM